MRPTSSAAVYRPDLGMVVMEFVEGQSMGFIGLQVMPLFPVSKQAASYPVIPKEAMLKLAETRRASRAAYNRDDWEYERGIYATDEHGFEEPVDDVERSLFDQEDPGISDQIAVARAWIKIMRNQEKRVADMVFNATNFSAHAITHEWDDATNAVPITDINTAKLAVRAACGMLPNTLIVSYSTFENLRNCAQVVDRIKYTYPGIDIANMSTQELARCIGVQNILVGGGVYDSAGKGIDASISDVWYNEYAMLTVVAPTVAQQPMISRDITAPCIGRTFLWTEDSPLNPIVEVYREDRIRSDVYRVRHHVSESLIASKDTSGTVVSNISAACSYLFSNVTTI